MKHDGVPSRGVLREGGGDGGWGSSQVKDSAVGLAVKLQDSGNVGEPVGIKRHVPGSGLEVDVSLRGTEGGVGPSLEEKKE